MRTETRRWRRLDGGTVRRAIAIQRGLYAAVFGAFAVGLVLARHGHRWWIGQAREVTDNTTPDGGLDWITDRLVDVVDLRGRLISVAMITAVLYCAAEAAASIGLWRDRRWAAYLTVVLTVAFLPMALHRLVDDVTFLRVAGVLVNAAVVAFLLWDQRLFGLRGGRNGANRSRDRPA